MVLALSEKLPSQFDSLADYPHAFVVACVVIVAVVGIWLFLKILKWTIWLLIVGAVVLGAGTLLWVLLH